MTRLRTTLRDLTGVAGDPIPFERQQQAYVARFRITGQPVEATEPPSIRDQDSEIRDIREQDINRSDTWGMKRSTLK